MVRFKLLEEKIVCLVSVFPGSTNHRLWHIFDILQLFVCFELTKAEMCQFFPIWSFTKFFSYLLHMGVQAPNKSIFFYFLQWDWNGNLTQIVLLTSLLRLFLINAVVISKPVVVIIFLLAFFIIFLLQMVHNLGFWLPSQYQTIGILHHLLLQTKSQLVSYLPMAGALKALLLGPFLFQWFHYGRELPWEILFFISVCTTFWQNSDTMD